MTGKNKRTGARLKVLRAERDVTQSKVARLAGMSPARYWQIENGEGSEPGADERAAVAAALSVRVTDIQWPEFVKAKAS